MWSWFLFYYERHLHMVIHMYISFVFLWYYIHLCIIYVCYTSMHYTFHSANFDHLHVRQILFFLFHPKPTGPEVLNWKSSSRWYSRPIRSIDEPRIWAATFVRFIMWSRLKPWLVNEGFFRRDRFYLYIPYFRGGNQSIIPYINPTASKSQVCFFSLLVSLKPC